MLKAPVVELKKKSGALYPLIRLISTTWATIFPY
jgi:hypothetical protein